MASRTRRYNILFMSGIMCILVLYQTDTMDKRLWTSFTESSSQLWYALRLEGLRPCTCNRCAMHDDDPWFTKRFNASLNPFLTQDNALSEHDFRWWKTLPFGNKPFLSYRVAELKVFEIFPEQESFMDSSPDRCRTCAVVGNSVNLLGSHYGPLIDFHDVIMRFNTARIVGYEGDVGNKTTLHIMYPESSVDLDDHTHLMLFPFKIRDLEWLVSAFTTKSVKSTYKQVKSTVKANQGLVKVLHPGFIQYVHENWLGKKGKYPSTGFMGVVLAMHICDEVNVFGFGADKDGNWNHYWEAFGRHFGTGQHGGGQEYKLILQLAERQKLNFYKGF
ncbi:CMP-N-acetylneuraminate-beta-galactosamide-alpha-2,3-sialyltransferase 1-like isoform X1 [Gadus macrocephalus]|uniref:CMP-N-acetylneuraminate-beta-galactosamide- alpha-2,3-sialyltransferase 1-like isoform X1 n=2 Tax=Gadus macrocephalus TaxID=80720 RepID=UPI0028CBB16D|nr:CMP-N-acetylneuraminate-beta-galactosamide-alpha-2,3-sialyltransferase 1-like isoform X1 [Gadus macrocephalus]